MSLYSAYLAFKQKQHLFWAVVAGIALFIAGWHTGRVMSPYYASHPIVFQDEGGSPVAAASDMPDQLAALKAQSEQLAAGTPTSQPQVAAAQTAQTSPTSSTSPIAATARAFVASVNSDLYHHESCPSVKQIKEENRVWFGTSEDAEAAGYSPSKCTQEKLGR